MTQLLFTTIHSQCKNDFGPEFVEGIGFHFNLSTTDSPFGNEYGLATFVNLTMEAQIDCTRIVELYINGDLSDYLPSVYLSIQNDPPDLDYTTLDDYLSLAEQKRMSIEDIFSEYQLKAQRLNFVDDTSWFLKWQMWVEEEEKDNDQRSNESIIEDLIYSFNETGSAIPSWYAYTTTFDYIQPHNRIECKHMQVQHLGATIE